MKTQIRHGVFETNSSSCHSLSIKKSRGDYKYDQLKRWVDEDDNTIHIGFGEFGWECKEYTDPFVKLEYALTMVVETECRDIKDVNEFFETDGFNEINDLIKRVCDCDGITLTSEMELRWYHPSYWDYDKKKEVTDSSITYWYINHDGYIDHQSCEGYKSLQDFLDYYGITLEEFIFDTGVELITDNDNH